MSQYKPYPAYKDSGVEWLEQIPIHWEINRFDAKTYTHRNSIDPSRLRDLTVFHYSIPTVQDIGTGKTEDGNTIDSNKIVINKKQLLVSKLNPHKQTIVVADKDICLTVASTEFVPLIPFDVDISYMTYIWKSNYCLHYLLARCESSTRSHQRVSPNDITRMQWAWPSISEQKLISLVLDRETTRIDALVAKKTRFIELLREKRQALITHAVTKGLDPNVKMKDSGVEWLGEVPEHWGLRRLKHIASFSGGGTPSRDNASYWNGNIPWVSPKDMKVEFIDSAEESITSEALQESSSSLIPTGRVLVVVRSGILRHTIPVAINNVEVALNQDMKSIKINKNYISSIFLMRFIQGLNDNLLKDWLKQGATVESIEQDYLANTCIPLPPPNEVKKIIDFMAVETIRIDAVVEKTTRSIELLKERRSALITAAVTGQIDLREST